MTFRDAFHVFHVKHPQSFHTIHTPVGRTESQAPAQPARRLRRVLVGAAAGAALFLAGCAGIARPEGWAQPVIAGNALLVQAAAGQVALVDPAAGSVAWRFPAEKDEANPLYATPIVNGSTFYLAGYGGTVRRMDLVNGVPLEAWSVQIEDRIVATPVLDGDTLFIPTEHGRIERLNVNSKALGQPIKTQLRRVWGAPVLSGGILYVGDLDRGITMALNPVTGETVWEQPAVGASSADLVVSGDTLYVASFDRSLHALDLGTGAERWDFVGDGWFMAPPLVQGDTVYAVTMRGTVYALDAATGTARWSQTLAESEFRAAPVLAGGTLVVIDRKGKIAGLDPSTGLPRWQVTVTDAQVNAHPAVRGSDVFLLTSKRELVRVDVANAGAIERRTVN